jgi:hypothetical protein
MLLTSLYQTFLSPDIFVDFSNKESVLKYYNSFVHWSFGEYDKHNAPVYRVEVKDNLVYFKDEYYLPAIYKPAPTYTEQKNVEDGTYNVHLLKRHLGYRLTDKAENSVNIFHIINRINTKPTTEQINKLVSRTKEIGVSSCSYSGIEYFQSNWHIHDIKLTSISKLLQYAYTHYEGNEVISLPYDLRYDLDNNLTDKINCILNTIRKNKEYRIGDRDQYDNSFGFIVIPEHSSRKIFDLIENEFKNYGKETH